MNVVSFVNWIRPAGVMWARPSRVKSGEGEKPLYVNSVVCEGVNAIDRADRSSKSFMVEMEEMMT